MATRSTAVALALALASAGAEAVSSEGAMNLRFLQQRESEHRRSLQQIESNMTTTSALNIVLQKSTSKPELHSFIQSSMGSTGAKKNNLRAGQLSAEEKAQYSGLEKATKMLNEMIEESQTKYDLEVEKCCEYDKYTSHERDILEGNIAKFNEEAAEARACVEDQNGIIMLCETQLPSLGDQLKAHNDECKSNQDELRRLLKITVEDISIMDAILTIIGTCPEEASSAAAASSSLFLMERCTAQGEDPNDNPEDECSYIQIKNGAVQSALSQLKSDAAKELVQDNLEELHQRELADTEEQADTSTLNTTVNTTTTFAEATLPETKLKRDGPCKKPKSADKKSSKCTPSQPNCLKMKEKFEVIKAGMMDKKNELEAQLAKLTAHCEKEKINFEDSIAAFEMKLKDGQQKLAVCTGTANYNDQQSALAGVALEALDKDYAKWTKECHKAYEAYESDICGVKKIRKELQKVKGDASATPIFFQDCEVSGWNPSTECSVTCGETGVYQMERTVMAPAVKGAACPVLTKQEKCNRKECPVDCVMDSWSEWSSCTAKCGGGYMARERTIDTEPMHEGKPCGETSESSSCFTQACDKDCVLADWTAWYPCTKACNTGHYIHYRRIKEVAIGNGKCPKWWKWNVRLGWKKCNNFRCRANIGCNSKRDVILVLDGSGSLGDYGWAATKRGGEALAKSFGKGGKDQVMLSVILFSTTAKVEQHFTLDTAAAAAKIKTLKFPRRWTYTSRALILAKNELPNGRNDADAVVVVFTDGKPMSNWNTRKAAWRLRREARLMFVPVTRFAPLYWIKRWASFPRNENIVRVSSFRWLDRWWVRDAIIANACPEII